MALLGTALILLGLPLFSVVVPPLGDYPNHLGRMHILASYADSPALQADYAVAWKLTPYLAMDLLVPPLTHFVSIYTAGRLFLFACLCLFVVGTCAVHAAVFRRLAVWPIGSALIAYNLVFRLGFVNYLFGVGIGLLAFAGWIVLSRHRVRWRIACGSLLSLAVFFSHIFAFVGYGICVVGFEVAVWLSDRDRKPAALSGRLFAAACTAIVPVIVFLSDLKDQDGGITRYGALEQKPTTWLSPVMFPGTPFDVAAQTFAVFVLVGGLLLGWVRLAPIMRVPLATLAIASLAAPSWLSGVWGIDYRLPLVFAFVLIASCSWQPGRPGLGALLACSMVVVLAADVVSITWVWGPIGFQYDEFRSAVRVIAPGAKVIVFREDTGGDPSRRQGQPFMYFHMPALAVIERDAYLPYLFKNSMEPVRAAPALREIDVPHGLPITLPELFAGADPEQGRAMLGRTDAAGFRNYWGDWPKHYDYAVELTSGAKPALPPQLEFLISGQMFNIYRIRK